MDKYRKGKVLTNLMNSYTPEKPLTSAIKIFQVTESDWWAGYDCATVRAAYREQVGEEADQMLAEFGVPLMLNEGDLDSFIVTDIDAPGQPKHTGREILADIATNHRKVPCFVATSEY